MKRFALLLACVPAIAVPHRVSDSADLTTRQDVCGTGNAHCCDTIALSSDPDAVHLLNLLSVDLKGGDVNVGIDCSPIPMTESSW